jgi:hypothetical protein
VVVKKAKKVSKKVPQLFWVSSIDHVDDQFVVARTVAKAKSMCGSDFAVTAELICACPEARNPDGDEPGSPTDDLLRSCGIEVMVLLPRSRKHAKLREAVRQGGRCYKMGERIFVEGDLGEIVLREQNEIVKN